jgi:hypothetical protein
MQDRRHRPGDVLDDYCPRERRITDHAIVAMIDDQIQRTRCGICDAEHDYKGGKVPTPRRKTQPPALFSQVLETMNGPAPPSSLVAPSGATAGVPPATAAAAVIDDEPVMMAAAREPEPPAVVEEPQPDQNASETPEGTETEEEREGGFRRSLIRATFPRTDGQAPTPRANPEFTIQALNNRRNNNGQRNAGGQNKFRGGRRRPGGGGGSQDNLGPMRFRDHNSQQGQGQGQGQNQGGGGRRRRGGKKNR